jgi:alanine racemase
MTRAQGSARGVNVNRLNAWTELDFEVLRANLEAVRSALPAPVEIIQVVKANAYGHGMETVATHAFRSGVRWFLVARLDEALALRAALPKAGILLLGAVWPLDVSELHSNAIIPILVSEDQGRSLAAEARRHNLTLACHAKIDTGMGRLGLAWQEAARVLGQLKAEGGLDIQGLCMHFAAVGGSDDAFAMIQGERFARVETKCHALGMTGLFKHLSNSAAFLAHPQWDMDGVRLGILGYGYGERLPGGRARTRPFLQWKTRVVQVKYVPKGFPVSYLSTHVTAEPTWLATIDVGYSDGFSRLMSNKGQVLVGGRRAKVVGRVTMNFTVIDVGSEGGVKEGDEVVLIGEQGDESLWADELARWCQTISYEILTSIRSQPWSGRAGSA